MNDLARDLGLSKRASEVLAVVHAKKLLEEGGKVTYFRSRESACLQHFWSDGGFVYRHNVHGLRRSWEFHPIYAIEWQLFSNSSKRSLQCVLLHNGNLFSTVPAEHSVCLCEKHEDIKRAFDLLQYKMHKWIICVDFKIVCFFLGQPRGYTMYPYFFVYVGQQTSWEVSGPVEELAAKIYLQPAYPKILHKPLVDKKNIIFPPLHIKPDLMKQFVEALSTEKDIKYLISWFLACLWKRKGRCVWRSTDSAAH